MARPALTDEQRRGIRRSIRAAASKLHAENGMQEISARAIAQSAGVSVGTIYSHFGNLTELMQSLWKQPARKMIEDMESAANTGNATERLKNLIDIYIQFSRDNWSVYRGAFMFVRPDEHEAPPQVALDQDRMFKILKQTIIDGQSRGEFRSGDPDQITQTLWSGIHGAIALPTNFHRLALDASPERVDSMLDLLFEWVQTTTNS